MPNYNPNTEGLSQPKWVNKPVKIYRLPEPIADDVLAYAHLLDKGDVAPIVIILNHALGLPANKAGGFHFPKCDRYLQKKLSIFPIKFSLIFIR
ncbi:hypothetical protein [Planktothrix paucivesiculata]|uniref:Uncharacterized protein n=1 Tax=Planktothrix paucivesiculata PCC 9631 TaxID=671071 RepID=A0A7Z9BNH8_9CYAN|nr:hypothetical protein [Planktothrix paucivesiculata]VXD18739.1 hypothetical protein PL9631_410032 [Planktothrix paucivesiculata PCC 9631]